MGRSDEPARCPDLHVFAKHLDDAGMDLQKMPLMLLPGLGDLGIVIWELRRTGYSIHLRVVAQPLDRELPSHAFIEEVSFRHRLPGEKEHRKLQARWHPYGDD